MRETCVLAQNCKHRMKRVLRYWETIIVAAVIAYGSLLREPHFRLPDIPHTDKWAHLLMYIALGAVLFWDLCRDKRQGWTLWLTAIIAPILFGGLIEILQENFFYPRTGDWMDWLADSVGTLVGCALSYGVHRVWYGRRTAK